MKEVQQFKEFLEAIQADPDLKERIKAANGGHECATIAEEAGFKVYNFMKMWLVPLEGEPPENWKDYLLEGKLE